ncbi:MAG: hypothetical protein CL878_15440 [Dehalococcoidia bacterium]|nr:hypothetical protein [Dehalococcoidia bacterium]
MARPAGLTQDRVIRALLVAGGNIAEAARDLAVTRESVDRWRQRHPRVQAAVTQAREARVDQAETVLGFHLECLNLDAAKYTLDRLGASRGYVRQEKVSQDTSIEIRVVMVPDRELPAEDPEVQEPGTDDERLSRTGPGCPQEQSLTGS